MMDESGSVAGSVPTSSAGSTPSTTREQAESQPVASNGEGQVVTGPLQPIAPTKSSEMESKDKGVLSPSSTTSSPLERAKDATRPRRKSELVVASSQSPLSYRPPVVVSKTGFLTKRSISSMEAFANWKRRFFVLSNGELSYYKQQSGLFASQKEELAHLKGELSLSADTVVRKCQIDGKCNCFEVKTSTKTLYAQADTAQEAEEWIEALRTHVSSLRRAASASVEAANGRGRRNTGPDGSIPQAITHSQISLKLNDKRHFRRKSATLDLRQVRQKQFQLWDAVEEGDEATVAKLLDEAVVDVNGKGVDQWTALHIASSKNYPEMTELLLDRGAIINAKTRDKMTALHLAAKKGYVGVVDVLSLRGANPNAQDQQGNTAMHYAAETGQIEMVKLLLAREGRNDVINATGSLPVHFAPIGHPVRVLLAVRPGGPEAGQNVQHSAHSEGEEARNWFFNRYKPELALGPRDFEFVKVLGRGAFAKVYLVRGKGSNSDNWYAMKAYNKHSILQKNQARYIMTEKNTFQASVDHPFIVQMHYAFQTEDRLFFVMDYCSGGDLLSHLSKMKFFSEADAKFYIAQIILALEFLHSKGIVFRDLKPENVVIDSGGNALLTDFGISKEGLADDATANTFCGSPMYLAPEMLQKAGHGHTLDWYSVGALLYEMLTGLPPFYNNDKQKLFQNILHGELTVPQNLSSEAQSLLVGLLQRDPTKRLGANGAQEIKAHPFFADMDWEALLQKQLRAPLAGKVKDTSDLAKLHGRADAISDHEKGAIGVSGYYSRSSRDKVFKDFDYQPTLEIDEQAIKLLQEATFQTPRASQTISEEHSL